jgi:hypothetical protein
MENKFELDGRKFSIEKPTPGQLQDLKDFFDFDFETGKFDSKKVIKNPREMGRVIAIIVKEDGKQLDQKDLDELTKFFSYRITFDEFPEYLQLFFANLGGASGKRTATVSKSSRKEKSEKGKEESSTS